MAERNAIPQLEVGRLQIPTNDPKAAAVDFRPLAAIGDTIAEYRRKGAIADAIQSATGENGQIDFNRAGTALSKIGALDEGRQMLSLALQKEAAARAGAGQAETSRHNKAMEGLAQRQYEEGKISPGFMKTEAGAMSPIPGGIADPAYIAKVAEAKAKETSGDKIENQIAARESIAKSRNMDLNDPSIKAWTLTGTLPKENQQPLTATDKEAIGKADELVLANENAIDSLTRAKELSAKSLEGPLASQRGYVKSLFGNEAGENTTKLTNEVTTNSLGQLKAIFGGNPTEGERAILLEIQGSANQPDKVRQDIYSRAIQLAQKRLDFNQKRAEDLRAGTFYMSPEMKAKRAERDAKRNGTTPVAAEGKGDAAKALPKVQNDAEANALIAQAREAVASKAPRDAVLKRLIDAGVPAAAAAAALGQ